MALINKILCFFGWHIPRTYYNNAYRDGINRPHSWCKYCGHHVPLFGLRKRKKIFGKIRQKNYIYSKWKK